MRKTNMIEIVPVAACLLFAILISLYHLSFEGYLGLSEDTWGAVWSIAENGFALTLCLMISTYFSGFIKILFKYVFISYFILKIVYHFSCMSGTYLLPADKWEFLWSVMLVILFIVTLVYSLIVIHKRHA